MSEKYTGKADDRVYAGDTVEISYNLKRCLHAAYCVNNLAAVFDSKRRPWIAPNGAAADEVVAVVTQCPSGALHTTRRDGGAEEATPTANEISVWRDGPVQFWGDLEIVGTTVAVEQETRATLCRCGSSRNKPFCDNSHKDITFTATEHAPTDSVTAPAEATFVRGGELRITAHPNGPLEVQGNVEVFNESGTRIFAGSEVWLCRCGGSQEKPFCDGSHNHNGFQAD
jgi:CDGSH-type Zn-finger protein/uncharacterized Fe-S cluster protein YjdI